MSKATKHSTPLKAKAAKRRRTTEGRVMNADASDLDCIRQEQRDLPVPVVDEILDSYCGDVEATFPPA
jgi:hypothetical protein